MTTSIIALYCFDMILSKQITNHCNSESVLNIQYRKTNTIVINNKNNY